VPYSDQFTIGLSHQVTPSIAFDFDYVRSQGEDRGKRSDLNEMVVPFDESSRLFFPQLQGRLRVVDPIGEDTYDGLQFSFRKRFSNRSQWVVNYTWAKLRGNAEAGFDTEAECRACIGDDRDVGLYTNDTRHNLIGGAIYQFPGEWQVSGLVQAESGRALSSRSTQDLNGNGRRSAINPPLDFTPGPEGQTPGRGNFLGEPTVTIDLRVVKFINFGGDKQLQLMAEFFNLFNRVNEGRNIEEVFESAAFGTWDGGLETNQFQMQLGVRFNF
jgi:hypothetical protein